MLGGQTLGGHGLQPRISDLPMHLPVLFRNIIEDPFKQACLGKNEKGTQTKGGWSVYVWRRTVNEELRANWGGPSRGGKRIPYVSNTFVHRRPAAFERSPETVAATGDLSTSTMASNSALLPSVTVMPFPLQAGESNATAIYDASDSILAMKALRWKIWSGKWALRFYI